MAHDRLIELWLLALTLVVGAIAVAVAAIGVYLPYAAYDDVRISIDQFTVPTFDYRTNQLDARYPILTVINSGNRSVAIQELYLELGPAANGCDYWPRHKASVQPFVVKPGEILIKKVEVAEALSDVAALRPGKDGKRHFLMCIGGRATNPDASSQIFRGPIWLLEFADEQKSIEDILGKRTKLIDFGKPLKVVH